MEKVTPTKKLVYSNVDNVDWEGPMVEVIMQVPDCILDIEERIIDQLMEKFYEGYQKEINKIKPKLIEIIKSETSNE